VSGEQGKEAAYMQAASTEFVVDGVDPRVALEGALPVSALPTTPSSPPAPSRAP